MGGRPPKPTAQHIADGTYHVTRHRDRVTDTAFDGEIDTTPPEEFGEVASSTWNRVVATFPKDQLRSVDWDGLYWMCFWNERARELAKSIESASIVDDPVGYRKAQTAVVEAFKQFAFQAGRFGMTPADRAKLRMLPVEQKDDDPFKQLGLVEGDEEEAA